MLIKTSFLFISVFVLAFRLNAQKLDSLKNVLLSSDGINKYEALFGLAYEYSDVNDSLSLVYAGQAFDLALSLGDSARIIKGGRIKAGELRRLERIDEAIQTAQIVLGIAKRLNNIPETKLLLNSLAASYTLKAEYDKALKCNFESLVIREAEGNKKEISIALNNIGVIYYKLHDFYRSLDYYTKSLELKKQVNDHYDLDRLLINIGFCLNAIGDYKEARKYINEGLSECDGKCSDQIILEGEFCLGVSLLQSKSYNEALKHFEKSYEVAKRIGSFRFQAESKLNFARIYFVRKDYSMVLKYLNETESISKQKGYRFLLQSVYEMFSKLYNETNDYKNIAFYQSKFIAIKDSILSEKVISNLSQVRTAYEERANLKAIAEKDQVLALQKEIIVRQQRQFFFVTVITTLIVALAGMLFYFSKRQQKINRELSSAKNLIQEQNERLESYNKELEDKVNERTGDLVFSNSALQKVNDELDYFIYKSSHDIRGPLVTLKGMCNIALMDLKDPMAIDYFKKFDLTTDKLNVILTRLQMVNYVTHSELKPEDIDFKTIIDETIAFEKRKGISDRFSFSCEIEPDCNIVSDEFLVRTVLENLIDNAVKFRASSNRIAPFVRIKLIREANLVKVTVEDNGIGIHKYETEDIFKMFVRGSEQSEIGGVGLYLVKTALDKVGGSISLVHSDSNGSIFQALFPADLSAVIKARNKNEKKLVGLLEKQNEPASNQATVI
ncbi:MAG: tetratricopeptide repeat-containing sensor histidine kinase [Bacteroidetes bacterium]|nr:tetratricopeptide repeat-containing sensor histidine kinase [Bacteroidota bacterium]